MDSITQTLQMWQDAAILIITILVTILAIHYLSKIWKSPESVSLILFLGIGLISVALLYCYLVHRWTFGLKPQLLFFIMLYLWCAAGMLFLSLGNISALKLIIGLLLQAGILYELYQWI